MHTRKHGSLYLLALHAGAGWVSAPPPVEHRSRCTLFVCTVNDDASPLATVSDVSLREGAPIDARLRGDSMRERPPSWSAATLSDVSRREGAPDMDDRLRGVGTGPLSSPAAARRAEILIAT